MYCTVSCQDNLRLPFSTLACANRQQNSSSRLPDRQGRGSILFFLRTEHDNFKNIMIWTIISAVQGFLDQAWVITFDTIHLFHSKLSSEDRGINTNRHNVSQENTKWKTTKIVPICGISVLKPQTCLRCCLRANSVRFNQPPQLH